MAQVTSVKSYLAKVEGLDAHLYDLVEIDSSPPIYGEVIKIRGKTSFVQLFSPPTNIGFKEKARSLGKPLQVLLGPHLKDAVFDGIMNDFGNADFYSPFGERSIKKHGKFDFSPVVKKGQQITGSEVVGYVGDFPILSPPDFKGRVEKVMEGKHYLDEPVVLCDSGEIHLSHEWPIRKPRPFKKRLSRVDLMETGVRAVDTFFPIKKGGVAIVPGPFGSGKTVFQESLAFNASADVRIFVACGERGNEVADFLGRIGKSSGFTVVANTSNMPMVTRESSIFSSLTVAEYYRDAGMHTVVMMDSLSRWAEAVREISGLAEVIPAEEGYPPYLQDEMEKVFSRAGYFSTLSGKKASITVVASISPPSADFTEPITQYASAITSVGLFLSPELAYARIYPAIDFSMSFSRYLSSFIKQGKAGKDIREALDLIHRGMRIEEIEKVVGADALSKTQLLELHFLRLLRDAFILQNAFVKNDSSTPKWKQEKMLFLIMLYYRYSKALFYKYGVLKFDEEVEKGLLSLKLLDDEEFIRTAKRLEEVLLYG